MPQNKHNKILQGEVISAKTPKTIVVKVTTRKRHPKYHKQYTVSRKYKAHDENGEYQQGDVVQIVETRPLSKEKRWKVRGKIK